MIDTELNPSWLDPDVYVAFLNRCFPGQWNRTSFEWYLNRAFNGRPTDLMVRRTGRRILAGISFCYRQVMDGGGRSMDVCIASAGATLAAERGRGHYRALLDAAVELCRARRCDALLGFVTRSNGSGRGLLRLGAHALPSFYLTSRAAPGRPARVPGRRLRELESPVADWRRLESGSSAAVRIVYPGLEEWRAQFLERPQPVRTLRLAHDAVALLERVATTDRLQWLGCPAAKRIACIAALAAASHAAGRRFFCYTMDPLLARAASRMGLAIRGGYLIVLPISTGADVARFAAADWSLQSGDRM